jgi:hypothetical protein
LVGLGPGLVESLDEQEQKQGQLKLNRRRAQPDPRRRTSGCRGLMAVRAPSQVEGARAVVA